MVKDHEKIAKLFMKVEKSIGQEQDIVSTMKLCKDIKKRRIFDFQGFKVMITKHKNFEEGEVYPKLDQELGEAEKKVIIERINEIL